MSDVDHSAHVHAFHAYQYARTIAQHRRKEAAELLTDLRCVACAELAPVRCGCACPFVRATWDENRAQWVSADAEGQGYSYRYSVARTLHTLSGLVRTWPTAKAARDWARRAVAREHSR